MNKIERRFLSVDEIVAYLKRTNLPTVLVEGSDDRAVYRYLEERLYGIDADVLICNGRPALLGVFKRAGEYPNAKVAFVADRDMWYFTGIPAEYQSGIIYTDGYSIENDLYVRDVFEGLLSEEERVNYRAVIQELCRWFAFEVNRYRSTGAALCDAHTSEILQGNSELCPRFVQKVGFIDPGAQAVDAIFSAYSEALRGKTLFQAILRFLSSSSRSSKFSRQNLLEMGAKLSNPRIDRLLADTQTSLTA